MKILKYIIGIFLLASTFYACQDEAYEPKSSFSDAGFYTSYGTQIARSASVGDYEAFMDISQGAIYHYWAIDSGNYFIDGRSIPRSEKNYEKYIMNAGDTSITDINANVLFGRGDTAFTVRLFNVFEDSVAWRGVDESIGWSSELGAYVPKNTAAVYQDSGEWAGKWVFQYDILVDVYDTIVTDMVLRQDGAVIPHDELIEVIADGDTMLVGDTIDIMVGAELQFEDLSDLVDNTARPDDRTWQIRTIPESENEEYTVVGSSNQKVANITFRKMGIFNVALIAKRSATESVPADTEEYVMPLIVRVNQSNLPFEQKGIIRQLADGTLQVPFNAEFDPSFGNESEHFTVNVTGDFARSINVTALSLHPTNASNLILTLESALYDGDVATLDYFGTEETSDLMSTDERPLTAFADANVILFDPNMIDYEAAGFEDFLGNYWISTVGANNVDAMYSTEQKFSGQNSMKLSAVNPGYAGGVERGRFQSSAGDLLVLDKSIIYTVRYKRFVVSEGLDFGSAADKVYLQVGGAKTQINTALASVASANWKPEFHDMWEEIEYDIDLSGVSMDFNGAFFYIQVNPGSFTVYYDDFYIAPKVERP